MEEVEEEGGALEVGIEMRGSIVSSSISTHLAIVLLKKTKTTTTTMNYSFFKSCLQDYKGVASLKLYSREFMISYICASISYCVPVCCVRH